MHEIVDIEKTAGNFRQIAGEGFAAASWVLARDKDSESFIFRKFNKLSARNLLYLQCEVVAIEERFNCLDRVFLESTDTGLTEAARKWEKLNDMNNENAVKMMETIRDLRSRMKEYHEALKLHAEINGLGRPHPRALEATKCLLQHPTYLIGGQVRKYLDDENDLVTLRPPSEVDILSKGLRACWPGQDEFSRDGIHRVRRYDESSIAVAVNILSIIFAAILLLGAIVSFSFVTTWAAKMGLICSFTIAFALVVGLTTSAKRAEIFAATAAYAAVLVVFVSNGDLSGNQQCCQA